MTVIQTPPRIVLVEKPAPRGEADLPQPSAELIKAHRNARQA